MQTPTMKPNRLLARIEPQTQLDTVHVGIEAELNAVRIGEVPESGEGMAQLIDPKGNRNIIVRLGFAERWCQADSDWSFEVIS